MRQRAANISFLCSYCFIADLNYSYISVTSSSLLWLISHTQDCLKLMSTLVVSYILFKNILLSLIIYSFNICKTFSFVCLFNIPFWLKFENCSICIAMISCLTFILTLFIEFNWKIWKGNLYNATIWNRHLWLISKITW